MGFVPVPQSVEVEFRWTLDSQKCENRFYVALGAEPTLANMNEVGAAATSWLHTSYVPLVNGAITFTEIVITDATLQQGVQLTIPINEVGGTAGPMLPNEASFCVSLRSNRRGRSSRGRFYMPPPDESSRLGINRVTPAYLASAVNLGQALINDMVTAGFNLCVASFVRNKVHLTEAITTNYLSAVATDDLLDSMRSRKPGNGA